MKNTFGNNVAITIFGESHGEYIGAVLDGLAPGVKVDITATAMCKQNNLPIYVFNMDVVGNLKKVMDGEEIGTYVHP